MEASKGFHGRGCMWDLVAYHWADGKDWIERRKMEAIERRDFVTYALTYTQSATTGRSPIGSPMKIVVFEKTGRRVDQVVMRVSTRDDGTTVEMRDDRQIAEKWINGYHIMAKRYNEKMEKIQVMSAFLVEKKIGAADCEHGNFCEASMFAENTNLRTR